MPYQFWLNVFAKWKRKLIELIFTRQRTFIARTIGAIETEMVIDSGFLLDHNRGTEKLFLSFRFVLLAQERWKEEEKKNCEKERTDDDGGTKASQSVAGGGKKEIFMGSLAVA